MDVGGWLRRLGLVPRQYSTGGRSILGRISKRGSKYLRTLFIQAANVILMRPHNWERFSFGAWLLNAAPRLHRNKLATALANKLARIAWSILRNERPLTLTVTRPWRSEPRPHPSSRQRKCMERINERIQSLVALMVAGQPVR